MEGRERGEPFGTLRPDCAPVHQLSGWSHLNDRVAMRTRTDAGELISPSRLLEMLEFRFGAFKAIAYAAAELADKEPDFYPAMDKLTASAILEFGDDLHQAYEAAIEWLEQECASTRPDRSRGCGHRQADADETGAFTGEHL